MKSKKLILLLIISIAFVSCRTPRFIYSPAPPNNPYFREKGESKLAAYYSTAADENDLKDEYNDGLDLQAAYAISDHLALTTDYFKRKEKDVFFNYDRNFFDSSIIRYDRTLTNFGAGYFTPLTKDKEIVINIFGGVGFGKFSFTENGYDNGANYSRYYNSKMTKWYIQPSFNFFPGKYFRTGLIGKISWVHYGKTTTSYLPAEIEYYDLNLLPGNTVSFFEATWNTQVTFEKTKWLYLDGGFTICTEPFDNDNNTFLDARNFNFSVGLSIDFSKMKKK
jgi:hypothetical protein